MRSPPCCFRSAVRCQDKRRAFSCLFASARGASSREDATLRMQVHGELRILFRRIRIVNHGNLTVYYGAFILRHDTRNVHFLALFTSSIRQQFRALNQDPFTAFLVRIGAMNRSLPTIARATHLKLVRLNKVKVVRCGLISIYVSRVLRILVARRSRVTTFTVIRMFKGPYIARNRINNFHRRIITMITHIMFRMTRAPINNKRFHNPLRRQLAATSTFRFRHMVKHKTSKHLVPRIRTNSILRKGTQLPDLTFHGRVKFRVPTRRTSTMTSALVRRQVLAARRTGDLRRAKSTSRRMAPFVLSRMDRCLTRFRKVVLKLNANLRFLSQIQSLMNMRVLQVKAIFSIRSNISRSIFRRFQNGPTSRTTKATTKTPAVHKRMPRMNIRMMTRMLIILRTDLQTRRVIPSGILIN